jgi:hypothetical protein
MAHILYYRGVGEKVMAGITEYMVIVDADKVSHRDIAGNQCPGFMLHKDIEVDEDVHFLPCEQILTPKRMVLPPLPLPLHPILAKHEQDIQLYEALMGPTLGDLIYAMSILSDVQHMISEDPHVPEVEKINEAKALIMRGFNFLLKPL